jgi:hypothetical protein
MAETQSEAQAAEINMGGSDHAKEMRALSQWKGSQS